MAMENPFLPYIGENYTNNGQYYFDPSRIGQSLTPNYFYTGGSPDPAQTSGGGGGALDQWYIGPNGQLMSSGGIPLSTGSTPGSIPPGFSAPTQSQVNDKPSQFTGSSFDPARYLTYPGSLYGNGTGNGNPNTGMFAQQGGARMGYPPEPGQVGDTYAGPRPDPTKTYGNGYWNAQNDPQGFNHNIYAPFLSQNTDINTPVGRLANVLSQMLTSGEGPMRQAQQWLQQNVRPGATTMNPGADGSAIMRAWGQLNNGISVNGNATAGVGGRGNGIDPLTGGPVVTTPRTTSGESSTTGTFPAPPGLTVNSGGGEGGGNQGPQYRILQMPNGQQYRYRLTGNQAIDDREIARLQASWATGTQGGGDGGTGTQGGGTNRFDSYNNGLDALTRAILKLGPNTPITDALRRQARLPSRTELQMNQQFWQQNPSTSLDSSMFGGRVPTLNDTNFNAGTDIGYLPTGAAPQNFTYQWMDPDAAGANPGNWGLKFGGKINNYNDYQDMLSSVVNNSAYGNKAFDFGNYNDLFYNQGRLNTQGLNQNDFNRLLSMANSPFFGTPLGGGSALGNYIQSQGPGAIAAAGGTSSTNFPGYTSNKSGQGFASNYVDPYANQNLVSHAYDPGVDGTGMSPSQIAPITRDYVRYPGSGVEGGNNSLTSSTTTSNPATNTPVTLPPTGDGRPPKFNDSAYYNSTL